MCIRDRNNDLRPDFVVGVNNDRPRFYGNRNAANTPVCIALEGSSSNRLVIGAKATFVLNDGSTQSAEVYAGGGYLSQSTHKLFFGVPDGKKATKLKVRWPDGSDSEHKIDRLEDVIQIKKPT